MADKQVISPAKLAYEEKRAARAGKSIDAWLSEKQKKQTVAKAGPAAPAQKKPGLISRLLDRAHKPL
jgi:hypothetical protein